MTTTTEVVDLGAELVLNPDFAAGSDSGSQPSWELTAPGEGQRAELITEGDEAYVSLFAPATESDAWPEVRSQPFPVRPHNDYRLLAEGRTFTRGRLFLALVFLDEEGDEILLRGIGSPAVETSEWTAVEGTIESPFAAAAAYVVVRLPVSADTPGDSWGIDVKSVSVQEVLSR